MVILGSFRTDRGPLAVILNQIATSERNDQAWQLVNSDSRDETANDVSPRVTYFATQNGPAGPEPTFDT